MVSNEAGEEDMDAGYIWASMCITKKVEEFQHYHWGKHPCICAMLMFSVLQRLGNHGTISDDSAITDALEQVRLNTEAMTELSPSRRKTTRRHQMPSMR